MAPIDLVLFAEHSQKVPKYYLQPVQKKESKWPVFWAHFTDFTLVLMVTTWIVATIAHGLSFFIVTSSYPSIIGTFMKLTSVLLPLMLFSYFFFSYFFNHGQSFGLFSVKRRIEMKQSSFKDAFLWALWSSLLCFSCGLSAIFKISLLDKVKSHDWLYKDFISHKDYSHIQLIDRIEDFEKELPPQWIKDAA